MRCTFSKETLALHVEGDLSGREAELTSDHVKTCNECRRFLEDLRARQSLLKSLRWETVSPSECTGMRHDVMSIINRGEDRLGWALRIERALVLGFGWRSYALATCALIAIVSVSMFAQMRQAGPHARQSAAVFEGDSLLRPEGYRDWILVGPSASADRAGVNHGSASATPAAANVYINPAGYREYAKTGRFPEGTVTVWASATATLASVKDSTRFEGGWGFFDFAGLEGTASSKAQALSDASGCRACHQRDAETDQVFTQFYPTLHAARRAAQLAHL
jgi:hypothetical protein